jgi:hypothetical protein
MAQKCSQATRQQPPMVEQACTQWQQARCAQCRITLGLQPVDRRRMLPKAAGVGGHWSSVADMEAEMGEAEMGEAENGRGGKWDATNSTWVSWLTSFHQDEIGRLLPVENGDVL